MTDDVEWIIRYLISVGRMDPDRIGRRLTPRYCRTCGRFLLVGLDADRAALPIGLDPRPLTPTGEAVALICGAETYTGRRFRAGLSADRRSAREIAQRRDETVLAAHRCGINYPVALTRPPPEPDPVAGPDEPPPF